MYGYSTKPASEVREGDYVFIAGSKPFVVKEKPTEVDAGNGRRHIEVKGRTKFGRKEKGIVYQWHHKVLYRP